MSHFIVVAVGYHTPEELEKALAPFDEQGDDLRYRVFKDRTEEIKTEYETKQVKMIKLADGSTHYPWADQFKTGGGVLQDLTYPEDSQEVMVPVKELFESVADYAKDWHSDSGTDGKFGYWHNPNAKWDWWVVGGRWSGYFKIKPGSPRIVGQPGVFNNTPASDCADIIYKKDWDLQAQRAQAGQQAGQQYDQLYQNLGGRPLPPKWADTLAQHGGDRDLAREANWLHPTNVHLRAIESEFASYWGDLSTDFGCTREEFVTQAMEAEGIPFALLVKGEWIEKGQMGWFGVAHDEEDQAVWNKKVSELFDSLDPDTPLIAIDCHI